MAQFIKPPTPEEIRKARARSKLLTQLFKENNKIRLKDLLPKIQEIYECSREPAYRKLRGLVESNDCLVWERESPRKLYVVYSIRQHHKDTIYLTLFGDRRVYTLH